mgnify:CR=1 FL=1
MARDKRLKSERLPEQNHEGSLAYVTKLWRGALRTLRAQLRPFKLTTRAYFKIDH